MSSFQASLLREKVSFIDEEKADEHGNGIVVVRSNRLEMTLSQGGASEHIVIRGQNMPSVLRMASHTFFNFYRGGGAYSKREHPHHWENQWKKVVSKYEETYNPDNWGTVYIDGVKVFGTKDMPYVDILEQYADLDRQNYDMSMMTMEEALRESGKEVKVQGATNVATVITDEVEFLRCGVIHRAGGKDSTFNFIVNGGDVRTSRISHSFVMAADFLEGINLKHFIQTVQDKFSSQELGKGSPQVQQAREAAHRQGDLNRELRQYEGLYAVRYRPERPEFFVEDITF